MSNRRIAATFVNVGGLAAQVGKVIPAVLTALDDARAGWPAAHGHQPGGRGGGEPLCLEHGRGVNQCHLDGLDCTGDSLTLSDPTGEAAIRPDRAAQLRDELAQIAERLRRDMNRAADIVNATAARPPTARERRETTPAGERAGECWSCRRAKLWAPVYRSPIVNGRRLDLCQPCYNHRREFGALPSVYVVTHRRRSA